MWWYNLQDNRIKRGVEEKDKNDKETPCYCVLAKPIDDDSDDDFKIGVVSHQ